MSLLHALTDENNRLRRWSLYLFARHIELPLLRWGYHLLRGRHHHIGQVRLVRAAVGFGLAAPLGRLGDTAKPMPTAQVLRLLDSLEGPIAVGPCRCRSSHGGCNHPLETDIVIRTGAEAWTRAFPAQYRRIAREEAKRIVLECQRLGMWQMVFVHCPVNQENQYVICNCCRCGCVPYILNRELGQRAYPLLRGDYRTETSLALCTGHGACVAACPFGARALVHGKALLVNPCFGCGVCQTVCPEGAISMQPVQAPEPNRGPADRPGGQRLQ